MFPMLDPSGQKPHALGARFFALVVPMGVEYIKSPSALQVLEMRPGANSRAHVVPRSRSRHLRGIGKPERAALRGLQRRFFGAMPFASRERIKMFGGVNWDNLTELMHSKSILNGAYYASPFLDVSLRPVITSFVRAYEARFGRKPDFLAAQGFDAATIAFAALDRQGSNQGASFDSALNSIEQYDGLTGLISIDPSGELKRKFVTAQFKDGAIIEVSNSPSPTYVYHGADLVVQETAKLPDVMSNGKTL